MISFATSDSTIWNRDQFIIDLITKMINGSPTILLSANGEGPCAKSLGLYDLLDNMCDRFNYPKDKIFIHTCNLVERHHIYNIVINPQMMYLNTVQKHAPTTAVKQIKKHFGHFIAHSNMPRLHIGSHLFKHHRKKTLQTYHTDITNRYHRPFIGIEDLMYQQFDWDTIHSAINLIKKAPIKYDKIDQYPILNPTTLNITKLYPKFFVEIVNLTYWSGNTFYIDEKIWRPICMRTPFIVHGPQNFLIRLKKLGFKTFDQWWDEGYNQDPDGWQLTEIPKILDQIGQMSLSKLDEIYSDMKPTVDHNFELMKTMTKSQFYI